MKNPINFCVTGSVLALAILGLLAGSCKKSVPPQQPAAETEKSTESVKPEPNKADANAIKMVSLNIKLPHSVYIGTKIDVKVPDLDTSTKLRETFYVPEGTINAALGKPVTSNQEPIIGDLTIVTDGDKEAADGSFVEFGPGLTYVTIDLEAEYNIYAIVVWHYHQQQQAYFDVIVQVSDDPNFVSDCQDLIQQ